MPLDVLEQRPGLGAQAVGQRLEPARARRRILDAAEVRLIEEDALHVAREPPGIVVGQAERQRERQHADDVRAAEPRRDGRRRRPHHVHPGVATRHHPPGRLGMQADRLRRQAARDFDACPKAPQGAGLRQAEEDIAIDDELKGDRPARRIEREAVALEQAKIGDTRRQDRRELLRLAGASLVVGAAVGEQGASTQAGFRGMVEDRGESPWICWQTPREKADRIETAIDPQASAGEAAGFDERAQVAGHLSGSRPRVEPQADEIEFDVGEHGIEAPGVEGQAEAARVGARLEHEGQGVGATLEIQQGGLVRLKRVGLVHPLRHAPGGGGAPGAGLVAGLAIVERPNRETIERSRLGGFESRAEGFFRERPPRPVRRLAKRLTKRLAERLA